MSAAAGCAKYRTARVHDEQQEAEETGDPERLGAAAQPNDLGYDGARLREHLPAVEPGEATDGDAGATGHRRRQHQRPARDLTALRLDGALNEAHRGEPEDA